MHSNSAIGSTNSRLSSRKPAIKRQHLVIGLIAIVMVVSGVIAMTFASHSDNSAAKTASVSTSGSASLMTALDSGAATSAAEDGGTSQAVSISDPDIPSWATWHTRVRSADIGTDGIADTTALFKGTVTVTCGEQTAFTSPASWAVSDVFVNDIDRDGSNEIVFLVWKRGSYGDSQPFWSEGDETGFSQHVFIYKWQDGALKPLWMSSKVGIDIESMRIDDSGVLLLIATDGSRTTWDWEGWGLTLLSQQTASEAGIQTVNFLAVGDNIAHDSVYEGAYVADTGVFDFNPIYSQVRDRISSYDLASVCQETAFVSDPSLRSGYPLFATPQSMGDALVGAGFDIVLGATNHMNDIGQRGIDDTLAFWKGYPQITLLGIHDTPEDAASIDYVEKNGIKFALFDYTFSLNGHDLDEGQEYRIDQLAYNTDKLLSDVTTAEGSADLTICFLHIGEEYESTPTDEQVSLVTQLIDAGADLVICSHAHVIEPYQRVTTPSGNSGVVFYGLGNFMSHQTDLGTILGGAANIRIEKSTVNGTSTTSVADFELDPLVCHFPGDGSTTVYFLDDYDDTLAAQHYVNTLDQTVSMESLWNTYLDYTTVALQ